MWVRLGQGLAKYDAFVLGGEGDEEFMAELVRTMENQGLTCCIKDRDLLGEQFFLNTGSYFDTFIINIPDSTRKEN